MIWTVRKSLAGKAARKWNVGDVFIVDVSDTNAKKDVGVALSQLLVIAPGAKPQLYTTSTYSRSL